MTEIQDIGWLTLLRTAIANSPIVVMAPKQLPPPRDFADWCEQQPDVDAAILTWLRSQVRLRASVS